MVITFLQLKGLAPNLQSPLNSLPIETVDTSIYQSNGTGAIYDVTYLKDLDHESLLPYRNMFPPGAFHFHLASCFNQFINYFAYEYPWNSKATVSIKFGTVLPEAPSELKRKAPLNVQDPFETDRNCCGGLKYIKLFKKEFVRAAELIKNGEIGPVFEKGVPLHKRQEKKKKPKNRPPRAVLNNKKAPNETATRKENE
jgi:hypothetical protein